MILIKSGRYKPFFKQDEVKEIEVPNFYLDQYPVSVKHFQDFLKIHPEFQKSKILSIYKDERYLQDWPSDLLDTDELKKREKSPITHVSWFVARKYCESLDKRLPTITEWEYASDAEDPVVIEQILKWYAQKNETNVFSQVGKNKPNKFGLYDMHGLIWEWVEDFNSVMISPDSRAKGERAEMLYCAGGSVNAENVKEYATFMRFGFRSGLKGNYTTQSLGFRCAKNAGVK